GIFGGMMVGFGAVSLHAAAPTSPVTEGLKLWLKADTGIEVGEAGGVLEWQDQSGNENHASQPDETMAPKVVANAVNAKPALRFDGENDYLDVISSETMAMVGDITTFFVVKFDDFATYRGVWAKTEGNLPASTDYYLLPNAGVPRGFRGNGTLENLGSIDGTRAVRPNTYLVLGWESADKNFTHYFNGEAAGSGPINVEYADTGASLKIGTRSDFVTRLKGDLAELLIYDAALSDEDRNSVFDYLKSKYNLLNLPPTVRLTAPAENATIAAPGQFKLTATASDPDDRVVRVEFFANNSLIGTTYAAPYELTVNVETPGPVTFTARVVDERDASAVSTPVAVTITGSTTVPPLAANEHLKLWLKAESIEGEANSLVTNWIDSSGNNNSAIADLEDYAPTLVNDSINGNPAVRFDGTDDFLRVLEVENLALTGDIATYAVLKFDDFATYRAVWSQTGGGGGNLPRPNDWYFMPGSGISRFYRGTDEGAINASVDGGSAIAGTPAIAGFEQEGSTATQYFNGRQAGTTQFTFTPTDSSTDLLIGTRTDSVTRMKGDIAELLIFDAALTAAQRENLSKYLGVKYNIAALSATNVAPVVQLTGPTTGGQYTAPADVTLTATATDADGSIQRVEFYANGSLVGSATGPTFSMPLKINVGGEITLTAVAVDNQNKRTTSTSVVVNATGGNPPVPAEGLKLWLRADQGVTTATGGAVTLWADFSGSFNNASQAITDQAPTVLANAVNGKPAIHFDGADDYLSVGSSPSLALTDDLTTFFVVRMDDFAGYHAVWTKTSGNQAQPFDWYTLPETGVPQLFRGGAGGFDTAQGVTALVEDEFAVVGFDVDNVNATANHYLNGENNGSLFITRPAANAGTPLLIGTRGDLFTKMKGDIAEIIIYDRLLNESERGAVMNYLNERYSIGQVQVRLTIAAQTANTITFAWPMAAGNYMLESTTDFVTWTADPNDVVMDEDMMTVTVNTTGTARFFRLAQQP
ncbi:MAG: LamG-like jellyroll fold domain-containing protein, partial [Verrucomicrobiales bacterium]